MKLSTKQAVLLSRAISIAIEPERKHRSESLKVACVRLVLEGGFGAENVESETRSALKRAEEVRIGIGKGRTGEESKKEEPKKEEPKKEEPKKEEPKKEEPKKEEPKKEEPKKEEPKKEEPKK